MKELIFYFEVDDISVDEDTGELSPGGIAIKIGGVEEGAYYYLADNIDAFTDSLLENLIDFLGLTSFLNGKSYRVVDEDYYMSNYG